MSRLVAPHHPSRRRIGLTLVELLVVIGIIALLIATLIPILGKARETAKRTVCLSNQREVHRSFMLYAHENDDRVPIGYRRAKQFNSMVYSRTAREYVLFGKLYPAGHMPNGSVFFCPSETNAQFQFDHLANPWPPGPAQRVSSVGNEPLSFQAGRDNADFNTYSGFAGRPDHELPDDFAQPGTFGQFVVPKMNSFRNRAIIADLMNSPGRLNSRHEDGVNVLYGHGGAHWVPRDVFEEPLEASPEPRWPPNPDIDPLQDAIWDAFDRHQ